MATYEWRGRNARGELIQGKMDAQTEYSVADQLMDMGVTPVHIAIEAVKVKAENWLQ